MTGGLAGGDGATVVVVGGDGSGGMNGGKAARTQQCMPLQPRPEHEVGDVE